jgi:S-adenosyl methyltransferase
VLVERPFWAPEDVDLDRPSIARVYDYYLGGTHNFAADRAFAEAVLAATPDVRTAALDNRAFLRRAVRYLSGRGIRQFIDLGSGIPTAGNVHEHAPGSKVVYVDLDPVAVAHSRAILDGVPDAAVVAGDLRRPAEVLANPALRGIVDFREPVAIMLLAVLHFVTPEEHPEDIVAGYAAASVPGSYIVISHAGPVTGRPLTDEETKSYEAYRRSPTPVVLRSAAEVEALFGDLTILEPGVVPTPLWRPDGPTDDIPEASMLVSAGIGRKD